MEKRPKQAQLSSDVTISYTEHGSGTPLLCITGINATQTMWSARFIAALAEHFRVITYDHRGVGGSVGPRPHSITAFADDARLLIHYLGLKQAHVFGVSMGGMVAQHMAVYFQDFVDHLILGATACAGHLVRPKLKVLLGALFYLKPDLAARALVSDNYLKADPSHLPRLLATMKSSSAGTAVFLEQLVAIASFNLRSEIGKIKAPTLILSGTDDQIISHQNSDLIAAAISGASLIKWDGVGHLFPRERPEATAQALFDFVCNSRR
ncbi:MAG: alpha/beta hydrolase [Deltaproteobacteria bacterium]|nr:alpha/beta hydrolase [Deltaproteobacteria bacterium]